MNIHWVLIPHVTEIICNTLTAVVTNRKPFTCIDRSINIIHQHCLCWQISSFEFKARHCFALWVINHLFEVTAASMQEHLKGFHPFLGTEALTEKKHLDCVPEQSGKLCHSIKISYSKNRTISKMFKYQNIFYKG